MQPDKSAKQSEKSKGEGTTERPSAKKKLLPVIFVVVLATVLFLAGALILVSKMGFAVPLLGGLFDKHPREGVIKEPAYMYAVPEILVNMPEGGRRFLSIKFYLGFDEPKVENELEKRMPEIRDAVNKILWSKTTEEIGTPGGKEELREELLEAINAMLHDGKLRGLYFWHVLIQ